MTIIAEVYSEKSETSFYIADCLASRDDKLEIDDITPMHYRTGTLRMTTGRALVSKALRRDKRFILSSGYFKNILRYAKDFVALGDIQGFQKYLDANYAETLRTKGYVEEGYIYSEAHGDGFLHSDSYCDHLKKRDIFISFAGSGAKHIRKLWGRAELPDGVPPDAVAMELLANLIRQEFVDTSSSEDGYGGAFELFHNESGHFERVPYAIIDISADEKCKVGKNRYLENFVLNRIVMAIPEERGSSFHCANLTDTPGTVIERTFWAPEIDAGGSFDANRYSLSDEDFRESFSPRLTVALVRASPEVSFRILPGAGYQISKSGEALGISMTSEVYKAFKGPHWGFEDAR